MTRRHVRSVTLAIAAIVLGACGGGEKGTGPAPTPSIAIAVSPPTLNVTQGASATVTVTISRGGGFAGVVNVSVEGVPSGVQVGFTPATVAASGSTSDIAFTVTPTAAPGPYGLTVRATGSGVTQQSVPLALTVASSPRPTADRVDDVTGSQIHVLYVLPSDGTDRLLDLNGTLANTVGSWQTWFAGQTGGRRFRLDTFGGTLDVTFVRLTRTDAVMKSYGAFVRDTIEKELIARGFTVATKVYAVYYDGGSTWACGGGAWPPALPGRVGVMYLQGTPAGAPGCNTNPLATSPTAAAGYMELGMIHEVLHTLGFVAAGAPHQVLSGHVPEPNDLMYAGSAPWAVPNLVIDVGRDDYYGDNLPAGVPNLRDSPYLTSATGSMVDPLIAGEALGTAFADARRLPVWLTRTTNETGARYSFLH